MRRENIELHFWFIEISRGQPMGGPRYCLGVGARWCRSAAALATRCRVSGRRSAGRRPTLQPPLGVVRSSQPAPEAGSPRDRPLRGEVGMESVPDMTQAHRPSRRPRGDQVGRFNRSRGLRRAGRGCPQIDAAHRFGRQRQEMNRMPRATSIHMPPAGFSVSTKLVDTQ